MSNDEYSATARVRLLWFIRSAGVVLATTGLAKAFSAIGAAIKNVISSSFRARPLGVILTIAAPLIIVGWHMAALIARPNVGRIVAELDSVMRFVGDPSPNHAGTRILFVQTTEKGFGIYFCRLPNGQRRLLFEQIEARNEPAYNAKVKEEFLGWSPGDRYFAILYKLNNPSWSTSGQCAIVIGDGNTGDTLATVPVRETVSGGAWISPQTLVYCGSSRILHSIVQHQQQWRPQVFNPYFDKRNHKLNDKPPIQNLTAFDERTVVWQQGEAIWSCAVDSSTPPETIWEPTTNKLISFAFSQTGKKFLLQCEDAKGAGQYLVAFQPPSRGQSGRMDTIARIDPGENPLGCYAINHGSGYAYVSGFKGLFKRHLATLVSKPAHDRGETRFQWPGTVAKWIGGFTANDQALFADTSMSGEPTGIWKYAFDSGTLECVVSNGHPAFHYARPTTFETFVITNASGAPLNCYVLPPPRIKANRKYPLVICYQWGVNWEIGKQGFVNSGAICAGYDTDPSAESVLAVYQFMASRPEVDTNKVYLSGTSAGASPAFALLESKPELWRGAILFSPGHFPDPSRFSGARIFADTGDAEFGKAGAKVPMDFQDAAAKAGIPVRLLIHHGLKHTLSYRPAESERLREAMLFLSEQ